MPGAALAARGLAAWSALGALVPGVALCAVIAAASGFVAGLHGGPPLLYALFFGLCFHYLHDDERTRTGIDWCSRTLLRLGIALLGARITVAQMATLGWTTMAIVVAGIAATIAAGLLLARLLRLPASQGMLSGGATAICGASAALALSAVLPRSREQERFTLVVVAGVTTLSTLAMLSYPAIARALSLPPAAAGLFLGGSIHDVAQVVGAGHLMGPAVETQATLVKLLRISFLAPVVAVVALTARSRGLGDGTRTPVLPGFLVAFVALVALNSLGGIPAAWQPHAADVSRAGIVVAIAALGIKTSPRALMQAGWKALAMLVLETLWLASLMCIAAWLLSP
ncbi:YeiH family protein [Piscinibacter terrae]|uniref:Putative sulfate exporter family transporter n=1 Tax=Piscinibacter terrae TaxID=2496871 RepID=A0A3N7HJV1_9BURK|nr:putative sulfate exporter family transporter [Albitalea terrae]RQP21236.1 putative sulfate exporter family transporter [Albitalea terrae]